LSNPQWILNSTQLDANPPSLNYDNLTCSLLDFGFGSSVLLSIHKMEDEDVKNLSEDEKSRCGIIGRILAAIWVKLYEVKCSFKDFNK
jgi:hypothetical protein